MKVNKYSESEIEFLRENYKFYTVNELSKLLHRTKSSITSKLYDLEIHKPAKKIPKEIDDEIYLQKEHVINKKSATCIAKELGVKTYKVRLALKKYKISQRVYSLDDLTGKKFNKWTVIKEVEKSKWVSKARSWLCKCDCGKESIVTGTKLKCNRTKSCGCKSISKIKKYEEIELTHFKNIRNGAEIRNIQFDVTIEQVWNLFIKQNRKCALSGKELTFDSFRKSSQTASLDRIDSSKGYIIENIQWIHKELNMLKSNMDENTFLNWIKIIYLHKFRN